MGTRLTLFADASLCHKTGAAGWGAWAIRDDWDRGRFMGGVIDLQAGPVTSSNIAELAGIGYALWQLHQTAALSGVFAVNIQCDSVSALGLVLSEVKRARIIKSGRAFIGKTKDSHLATPVILKTIKRILEGRAVSLKHVKGHSSNDDGRSWVNRQCDAEARRHMIAQRKVLQGVVLSAAS